MGAPDAGWASVSEACRLCLAGLDQLVATCATELRMLPGYAEVPEESLLRLLRRNLGIAFTAVMERRPFSDSDIEDLLVTVEQRARQHLSLSDMISAFDVADEICYAALAAAVPIDPGAVDEMGSIRIQNLKRLHRSVAVIHRAVELDMDSTQRLGRAQILRDLLSGPMSAAEARSALGRLGMTARAQHWVFGFATAQTPMTVIPRLLGDAASPPTALFQIWDGAVVGLTARPLPPGGSGLQVAVAGPVDPAELPAAYAEMTTCLTVLRTWGGQGVVRLGDLGLLPAVLGQPAVGAALEARYVEPLRPLASLQAEILQTLSHFLDSGGNRKAAAQAMHLHPNSVRYRLDRFCELTGADLGNAGTVAELWWLLRHLEARAAADRI